MATNCDFCAYNEYDEADESYYCSVNMDEDDMARFLSSNYKECPYYKSGDEYQVVRHQMQRKESEYREEKEECIIIFTFGIGIDDRNPYVFAIKHRFMFLYNKLM